MEEEDQGQTRRRMKALREEIGFSLAPPRPGAPFPFCWVHSHLSLQHVFIASSGAVTVTVIAARWRITTSQRNGDRVFFWRGSVRNSHTVPREILTVSPHEHSPETERNLASRTTSLTEGIDPRAGTGRRSSNDTENARTAEHAKIALHLLT